MAKLVITLEEAALLSLQQVLLDEDPEAALEFVREYVEPQIPTRGNAACDSSRNNPFLHKREG